MNTRFDITTIAAALTARATELATALLGEPNRQLSSKRELRFGRKGSLAVVTRRHEGRLLVRPREWRRRRPHQSHRACAGHLLP